MAPIPCPAPGCTTTFQEDLADELLGQLIALHAQTAHPPAATPATTPNTKAEKVRRPTITSSGTQEEWLYFLQRWQMYKEATKLEGRDVLYQLLESCDDQLRKDIIRTHGTLTNGTEQQALESIRTLAVRPENVMVSRVELQNLQQDRDETVRSYCARLRGQASVCQFTKMKKCTCNADVTIDYSNEMVRDSLVRGLEDEDIRVEILGSCVQNMSLEETLTLIEAKESGKRSASRLHTNSPTVTTNATSSYKQRPPNYQSNQKNKPPQNPATNSTQPHCFHCGQVGHGDGRNRRERRKHCPAYNHICTKCNIRHHHENVCRNSQRKPQSNPNEHQNATQDAVFQQMISNSENGFFEAAVFDQLCTTTDSTPTYSNSITLDHHLYDQICKSWKKRRSDPQPYITVLVTADPTDTSDLKFTPAFSNSITVSYNAIADTGCQSCLAGEELLQKLNIQKSQLIPVSMKMSAANNKSISIIGALPLRLTGTSPSGTSLTTREMVYFTETTNRLFLSKHAKHAGTSRPINF